MPSEFGDCFQSVEFHKLLPISKTGCCFWFVCYSAYTLPLTCKSCRPSHRWMGRKTNTDESSKTTAALKQLLFCFMVGSFVGWFSSTDFLDFIFSSLATQTLQNFRRNYKIFSAQIYFSNDVKNIFF